MNDRHRIPLSRLRRLFSLRQHTGSISGFRSVSRCAGPLPLLLVLSACWLLVSALPLSAASPGENLFSPGSLDPKAPWHITADEISFDEKKSQYIARGKAVISKSDRKLMADFVRFDQKAMTVLAKGHVVMSVAGDVLTADSMEMDLNTEIGTAYDGTLFLKQNHFYIRGSRLLKTGIQTYAAENASLTTCDGDKPAWRITGRKVQVTVEGYGTATHATLRAGRLPVLYTPYFIFPAKQKRQSGLLLPQIGGSDRKGFEYAQPVFWAIGDSTDATLYLDYMEKRGLKVGGEFRYTLSDKTRGTLMMDYLNDRQVDDGQGENSSRYGYPSDGLLRPNPDRYWFRMKHNQKLFADLNAHLDLDIVSDQDYLSEWRNGPNGYYASDAQFEKYFNRGLDAYDASTRLNRLNLQRSWSSYSLNADLRWYDNVVLRRQSDTDPTLQRMPYIQFSGSRQKLFNSPLYWDLYSEYQYFYRQDGPTGHRVDVNPRVYWPLRMKSYASLEPSVGLRGTAWTGVDYDDETDTRDGSNTRGYGDFKLDLNSEIYRVFSSSFGNVKKIKESIRPQVVYEYVPSLEQDDLPLFDSIDRIAERNLLTYSLTALWTSKSLLPAQKKADGGKKADETGQKDEGDGEKETDSATANYGYNQFCRLKVSQSYDIERENNDDPEPFGTINAELQVTPLRYVTLQADARFDHYDSRFESHNLALNLWDLRGDKLFVEHRFTYDSSESIYALLELKLHDRVLAFGEYQRDLETDRDLKTGVGAKYTGSCWSLDLRYSDQEDDRRYAVVVSLTGLGQFGKTFAGSSMENPLTFD